MTIDLLQEDTRQRQQALDPSQSFIVQAPAGSGKTELLIQRLLTLLAHVNRPEEILAITFTKKAANEMRARLLKALKSAAFNPAPESAHARLTWSLARNVLSRDQQLNWQLLQNPNQLRIQTIDSLCSFLTRQLPMLSHFGSQPDIQNNALSLYREAVQEVLTHLEEGLAWSSAIAQLLLHLDNDLNKLHDLLIHLLAKRDQWLAFIQLDTHDVTIRKQLEHHLCLVIEDSLNSLKDPFPKSLETEIMSLARYAAANLKHQGIDSAICRLENNPTLPDTRASDKPAWLGLAQLLLTHEGQWRKTFDKRTGFPAPSQSQNPEEKSLFSAYKTRAMALMSTLREHEAIRHHLAAIPTLPHSRYDDEQWEILKALLHLLKIVAAQLRVSFQQHGKIDYIENATGARLALGDEASPTDLALSLDYQIKHILIDEFQDTSFTQYQLIEKLMTGWEPQDGRTLFIVGDPMQSIYRFREAEVGLFLRMRHEGIGQVSLTPLTLSVNFRSTAKLVNWNNTHFSQLFPAFNDMATGAVSYSASVANATEKQLDATVDIKAFQEDDHEGQADYILKIILATKKSFPDDKIAILVRSRSHLERLVPVLKKATIPYRAVNIDPLASRQCIQDLLALTAALLRPADRVAWLAILRAPWCGLTLSDLHTLAHPHQGKIIFELIQKKDLQSRLSLQGLKRLKRFIGIIKSQLAQRERVALREWIESTWQQLGGPACLRENTELEDTNAYFKLLAEFTEDDLSLNLDRLNEKIETLYADTPGEDDSLQIMTIHTAKGLEFDTVILPHLERKIPHNDNALLLWMDRPLANDRNALLLAPISGTGEATDPIYHYIAKQQQLKLGYETDRLLYVATTRAKKRLHLLFNQTASTSGSLLKNLLPCLTPALPGNEPFYQPDVSQPAPKILRKLHRLCDEWKHPRSHVASPPMVTHPPANGFSLLMPTAQYTGVVIHQILQRISESGCAWWQTESDEAKTHYIRQLFMLLRLPANALPTAIHKTKTCIHNTLQDKRGQWILHPHQDAHSELALSACINGKTENIILDRTFIDEENRRWIIDYKTRDAEEDHFALYQSQMRKYQEVMRLREDREIRLALYFPAIPLWKELESAIH